MKRLIFILAMFACVSSQGQGYMNTSINPLVDTSYHGRVLGYPLPGGNLICGFNFKSSMISQLLKVNILGDSLKTLPVTNGKYLIRINDNLFILLYEYNPYNFTALDSDLNVVNNITISQKNGYFSSSIDYSEKQIMEFKFDYYNDTLGIINYNLADGSVKDSFIFLKKGIIDTGNGIGLYQCLKLKNGQGHIIYGTTDYISTKNGPSYVHSHFLALIDDSGKTKWVHKIKAVNTVWNEIVNLQYHTDTSIFLLFNYAKDSSSAPQARLYEINIKGDTIRNELLKDSSYMYNYVDTKSQKLVVIRSNYAPIHTYSLFDTNYQPIQSYTRFFTQGRNITNIFPNDLGGWIELGYKLNPNKYKPEVSYIAQLDSTFCAYTQPDFDTGQVSGFFTVPLFSRSKNIYLDSIVGYNWTIDNVKGDSISNTTATFKNAGTHIVALKVINKSGCESILQKSIYINYPVGINEVQKNISLSVLNNPFNNELTIIYTGNEKTDIKLCDIAGRVVGKMVLNGAGRYSMNTAELHQGVYYLYNSVNNQSYMPIKVLKVE